ncbi:hypothetical protein MMC08_004604, partial [Hypocenomyce scalaris]|nr:hypothetical protein [Hypocenomyce scalaris]
MVQSQAKSNHTVCNHKINIMGDIKDPEKDATAKRDVTDERDLTADKRHSDDKNKSAVTENDAEKGAPTDDKAAAAADPNIEY